MKHVRWLGGLAALGLTAVLSGCVIAPLGPPVAVVQPGPVVVQPGYGYGHRQPHYPRPYYGYGHRGYWR